MISRVACGIVLGLSFARPADAQPLPVTIDRSQLERLIDRSKTRTAISVVGGAQLDTVSTDAARLQLEPDRYLASVLDTVALMDTTSGRRHLDLPIRYIRPDADARPSLSLSPAVEIEGGGLRFDPEDRQFRGRLLLGLEDSVQPAARRRLDPPIRFQLTSDAGAVEPRDLVITHTNIPFEVVGLESVVLDGDSVTVRVRPEFDPDGVSFRVPVHRPRLGLVPSTDRIQGFGFEAASLTVIAPDEAPADAGTVVLSATRGLPVPSTLVFSDDGVASGVIRSRGMGVATVTAASASAQLAPAAAEIEFVFPYWFMFATLIGAALGTVIARTRAQRRSEPVSARRTSAEAVSGFAAGVLAAAAYAVGINLTGLALDVHFGEAAVLVIAALGAIYGLPGLGKAVPAVARLGGEGASDT